MLVFDNASSDSCRYKSVDACSVEGFNPATDATPLAVALYQMPINDELDYGLDFSVWMAANHRSSMASATWAVAADSPKTPVLGVQAFDAAGMTNVLVTKGVGALVGDAYYLECTATFAAIPASAGILPIPARKLIRRIHIVLVRG